MKKCFMLALVLCTSAAFALDVSPLASRSRTSDLSNAEVAKDVERDASTKAINRTRSEMVTANQGAANLSPVAFQGEPGKNYGLRAEVCTDGIYSNGNFDGNNGLTNERGNFGIDSRCADDINLGSPATVGGIHWMGLISPDYGDTTIDILVLPDDGGAPNEDDGTALLNVSDVSGCRFDTGELAFGFYNIIVYSYYPAGGVSVPAGVTWFNGRPVSGSGGGRSFWATTNFGSPDSNPGMWRAPFFGQNTWGNASSQLGGESDFSLCVTGEFAGGSCCTDGDCAEITEKECAAKDGVFTEGAPCCSVICPGSPQACCFESGICENLKPGACDEAGGESQGDGNLCGPGACPLPDFCADSIFNQFGYDGVDGLSSQDSGDIGFIDAWSADNAVLVSSTDITGAVWQTIDRGNPDVTVGDYAIHYTAVAGGPGPIIGSGDNVTLDARLSDGTPMFGGLVYVLVVTTDTTRTVPGSYYIALRPRIETFVQSFWLTAVGDGVPGYFKSPFFGVPRWTNTEDYLGRSFEFSFCLLGQSGVGPYGACCLENDSVCKLLTEGECKNAGGNYGGDDSSCSPNLCPNARGACCFLDPYGCTDGLTNAECDAQGGTYQGGDVLCADTRCPLPDFCADSIHNQLSNGNITAYGNGRSDAFGYSYICADDVTLGSNHYISGIIVEDAIYNFGDPNNEVIDSASWTIYGTLGAGPGNQLYGESDIASFDYFNTGDLLFNFYVIYYLIIDFTDDAKLPSGQYYVNGRANWSVTAYHYWNCSDIGSGDPGYQSLNDGGSFTNVNQEFSFCLLGAATNDAFGACCTQDDSVCIIATPEECKEAGGNYQGDSSSCSPNNCPNARGACCFLDPFGCTDGLTGAECDTQGGAFQGGDTECRRVRCPLPDFCADSLHNQLHHANITAYGNGRSDAFGYSYIVADDVTLGSNTEITGIVLHDAIYNFGNPDNETIDSASWSIYGTNGSGPTSELDGESDIAPGAYANTGELLFNFYTIYILVINFDDAARLTPGQYYVNGRPNWSAQAYHYWDCTDIGSGDPGYQSLNNGGTWTNIGQELSYCLLGSTSNETWGACCTENDSICSIGTSAECDAAGGNYEGDGTSCSPNPCPNAPGACCLESGECLYVTPAECDDSGGVFQGGGVSCQAAQCPIPDPCDGEHGDVLFNNSTWNGVNGLWNADNTNTGYISAWCADDFNPTGDVTVGGIHFYDLNNAETDGTGDWSILGDNGDCLPDDGNSYGDGQDVAMLTLNTGQFLFGYRVMQNNIDTGAVALSAGRYWILGRPNQSAAAPAYWATANVVDCQGAFKSDDFGYPNWVHADTQFGQDQDFAYCLTGPADPCSGVERGDSNGDGDIDFDDIDCFVGALISQETWADCGTELPPGAFTCANDINQDGDVDFDDIDGFVECLINGTCD